MSGSDSAQKNDSNQGDDNITAIAFIRNGRCTHCQADLTEIIEQIRLGKILPPKQCPGCQATFSTARITYRPKYYYCLECDGRLFTADPAREAFCSHCGTRLIYPEGHIVPKKN